jgi:DNA-binding MarR family transcriptional regulator
VALPVNGLLRGYRQEVSSDLLPAAATVRAGVQRLSRRLQAERSPHGLSLTKISMLGHLARRGELTPGELAAADRLRPQSVTRVLAELESTGLVGRTLDVADRRQRRLFLTAAGRAALAADMRQRDEWLAQAMAEALTPTERDLLALAAGLLHRLSEHPGRQSGTTGGAGTGGRPGS